MTRLGHPTTAATIAERFAGVPHRIAWSQLSTELNLQLPTSWIDDLLLECQRRFPGELAPIRGAATAIQTIVERGDQVCVASSTELVSLRENLERTDLLPLLAPHVFSVDQVKRPKPAPDVFLFAASQMGVDPADTIVVEDSVAGVMAGKRAGMRVLGFTGGGHTYGSLASCLAAAGAEHVCDDMNQVVERLSL
ncbi:HAD superfamily hydrolase (TIGR01509 family) [Rhizobium viscosum]|uniref:HAD superfamily hydrolase (TIGR01509 family) n=1 Tax=Rhizobium viscosum TaxID=1673 RepID=A0ABR9IZU6_RHIVS|nr:HAD superfamily hydrolase (TIGR01509 family) [Rhizobium viscosum]